MEEDRIHELIGRPNLWHLEPEVIERRLKEIAKDTQIGNRLVFEKDWSFLVALFTSMNHH